MRTNLSCIFFLTVDHVRKLCIALRVLCLDMGISPLHGSRIDRNYFVSFIPVTSNLATCSILYAVTGRALSSGLASLRDTASVNGNLK